MSSLRDYFNAGGEEALRGLTGPVAHLYFADYILRQIEPAPGARVLDLGCGDGAVIAAVKHLRPDLECVGVDFAVAQIDKARGAHGRHVEFGVCDFLREPLAVGAFDRLFSFSVVQYLAPAEFADLARRLGGATRPGGRQAHLSIPDLRKRAILFQDGFLNDRPSGVAGAWLHMQKMLLVDLKRRLVGDRRRSADSIYHDAEELAALCAAQFATRIVRPSDSWYRFDLHLAPR
jgi:SAM-dependent methyltransferase